MSVVVWRAHLFSCGWPAKYDHIGFPRKGADKPRGDISKFYSKLSFTMAGGAFHKPRGHRNFFVSKSQISVLLAGSPSRPVPAIVLVVWI